jgi:hypothetical protein
MLKTLIGQAKSLVAIYARRGNVTRTIKAKTVKNALFTALYGAT